MKRSSERRRSRRAIVVALAVLVLTAACEPEAGSFARVMRAAFGADAPLGENAAAAFWEVEAAFRSRVPRTEDADRPIATIRAAYVRLVNDYIQPLVAEDLARRAVRALAESNMEPTSDRPAFLMEAAIDAMTDGLDPHTAFLNEQEFREMQVSTRGAFGGLGVEITRDQDAIRVVSPIEGTPAHRAGLKPGDRIVGVDGRSVRAMGLIEAVRLMRGEPGSDVVLDVERAGVTAFRVTITRAVIAVRPVRWHREDKFAYLRLSSFMETTERALREAWREIAASGGAEGLILDLRDNPGGLFDQSVAVSDAFLAGGGIVSVEGRSASDRRRFAADSEQIAIGLPLVVLINEGTASAGEIVAGALGDGGRATLLGRRTFGKGTVQSIIALPSQGALRLTTSLYRSPAGYLIQGFGVQPHVEIEGAVGADVRREGDLPGSLVVDLLDQIQTGIRTPASKLPESQCPQPAEGDDRLLGCAVALLRAGGVAQFFAAFGRR